MKRSKMFVVSVVVVIVGVVALALNLRVEDALRRFCRPRRHPKRSFRRDRRRAGAVRFAHFNLRNFPLDERPADRGSRLQPAHQHLRSARTCSPDSMPRSWVLSRSVTLGGFPRFCGVRVVIDPCGSCSRRVAVRVVSTSPWPGTAMPSSWWKAPSRSTPSSSNRGCGPALAVRLRSKLDPELDFTVVEVHLDSGRDDLQHRLDQVRAPGGLARGVVRPDRRFRSRPPGRFQHHGRPAGLGGGGARDGRRHPRRRRSRSSAQSPPGAASTGKARVGPMACFESSLLDQVYLRGLDATGPARSWLHCERLQCGDLISRTGDEDGTFFDVSDHCPVTFEVQVGKE